MSDLCALIVHLITNPDLPFALFRKNNRESLEQLPNLILTLTEEVKELKLSNSELMENMRYREVVARLEGPLTKSSTRSDFGLLVGESGESLLRYTHLCLCLFY